MMVLIAAGALVGCQSYQPKPLNDREVRAAWQARSSDADRVHDFVAALREKQQWSQEFDPSDGLSCAEAEIVALLFNGSLRERRAQLAATRAGAAEAGRWGDPTISFDVMRFVKQVPEPWIFGGAVSFTIPLSGRLEAEAALAEAEVGVEEARVLEAERAVIADVRAAWADWSASMLRREQLDAFIARLRDLEAVANRLEGVNELSRSEARLFAMERGTRQYEIINVEAEVTRHRLRLLALLGLRPDAPVEFDPQINAATVELGDDVEERLIRSHPQLMIRRAEYERAERSLHREIRRQYPDLGIGPAYEYEEGQSRIGLGFGLPLPVFNANRRGIAEAEAAREVAHVAFATMLERLVAELHQAQVAHEAARRSRRLLEETMIPQVEAQLSDVQQLIELGEIDALRLIDTLIRAQETKQMLIAVRLMEAQASIDLAALLESPGAVLSKEVAR